MTENLREIILRLPTAQKSVKGGPAYSRFVNRKAGGYLAAIAYRWRLTPNQVTAVSACFSFVAIVLLAATKPTVRLGLLIAALLALGYAFDSADGQLARLRGGGTPAGEWLDHVVDSVKICALHLAVLISIFRFDEPGEAWHLAIPLIWTLVASVTFFVIILNDQIRRTHGTAPTPSTSAPVMRSILVSPTDFGVLLLAFATYGWRGVFIIVYGLLLLANTAFLCLALVKWYREMSSLSAPSTERYLDD